MAEKILKSNLLTPIIITIFCGLCGALYAQQNTIIAGKAGKDELKAVCDKVENKVDNETLVQMIRVLELKNAHQDERLNKQEAILKEYGRVQYEQLKVLQKIQLEMQQMNKNGGG